jgi:hypothetical protein
MVSKVQYRRPAESWKGRRVISVVELENGAYKIPAGSSFTVTGKHGGFSLLMDPCPKCGVRVFISKVPPESVREA